MENGRRQHPCNTDYEHTEEEYFWYFWSPNLAGCPLIEGQDYDVISSKLSRKPNTTQTFPEYARLVRPNNVIRIDVLMGLNDESQSSNPFQSRDIAAPNYVQLHESLLRMGYQAQTWTEAEIKQLAPLSNNPNVFVETLTKKTDSLNIEIRFFFGGTSTDANGARASAFHYFMKDAIENASVYLYAGHSGLGEYLNIDLIEQRLKSEIQFPRDQYQVFFFNGCSSYPYYNSVYFERKGGSQNLDILTNGLATYFSVITPSSLALISAIDAFATSGVRTAYQNIIQQADSENLLGINGDEDNN